MELSDRIKILVEYSGKSIPKFSEYIGVKTPQAIRELITGRTKTLSKSMQDKILSSFPEISKAWLLSGDGKMKIIHSENVGSYQLSTHSDEGYTTILVPTAAKGGSLGSFSESANNYECERIVSPIKNADFAITVTGDSMSPEYPNGARILIKRINERAFIDWGRVYVLDTCNGAVVKKIMPGDSSDSVRCVSLNPEYPDFHVRFDDMFGMYRVLMMLTEK